MTDITSLLPHAGTAVMIERVVSWDEAGIVTATTRHRAADNPLRRDGRLASVHLAEFGAQAMAIHGGLRNLAAGLPMQPALLVSLRNFEFIREHIDDLGGELEITARVLLATPTSWQYEFVVTHEGLRLASGRVAAMAHALSADSPAGPA